ncbi:MAG: PolC-type DNA polymerase III [Anaerococcus sp.]|nr:PolC-type DNA polymerase III [Anaerococcus sp.]
MKIDLADLIDVKRGDFLITRAVYNKASNKLTLYIEGFTYNLTSELRKSLYEYFNFVNLEVDFNRLENIQKEASSENFSKKEENPAKSLHEERERALRDQINRTLESREKKKLEKEKVEEIKFGRKIKTDLIDIKDIYERKGMTNSLQGIVYGLSVFETKGGYFIYTFDLEDKTDAISCKLFANSKNNHKLALLKEGSAVRVEGVLNYDDYAHEDVFTINSMVDALIGKRVDTALDRRIELEIHTKMTNLDGFIDNKDLINTLKEWKVDTVGITDTETLQGLPDLYDSLEKEGIKMLSGAELLLVDDDLRILTNLSDKEVDPINKIEDGKFVVFDLETTGLSKYKDRITEIGAVKIENGKITEVYNELVNPQMLIPEKVVDLTGISNDMVKDKPKIDELLPGFLDFCKDYILVGQNADFDIGFVRENARRLGLDFNPLYLDTLPMARALFKDMKKFSLDKIARKLEIPAFNHHRASDDAKATGQIFIKMFKILMKEDGINLSNINKVKSYWPKSRHENFSVTVFAKNKEGLKNLYKLISESRMNYFHMEARTPLSLLQKYRKGLLVGSGSDQGMLFTYLANERSSKDISKVRDLFDFYQMAPSQIFEDRIAKGSLRDEDQVASINKQILQMAKEDDKLALASGAVRYLEKNDYILRNILHKGQYFSYHENRPLYYLRTTDDMLDGFSYLDPFDREDVVIRNPKLLAEKIESIRPIPKGTFPPKIEGSDKELRETCFKKARSIYGEDLPKIVEDRLNRELNSIISNGYAVLYIIAKKLVGKSNQDGYLVGSRGSVGSSFAATMADITEVNPLSPHYICPTCKHSEFFENDLLGSGIDYPDKTCPVCGSNMKKDGHNIPFEVFLGFEGDKEPDIDLNFAGEYQPNIHKYTEDLFGEGKVFRAGTIGAIQDNTAFGYIKKYSEDYGVDFTDAQVRKLQRGLKDVKRTTGQHPGGLIVVPDDIEIFDICPIQYPADDGRGDIKTTHFTYNMMHETLLKLDLLGHDVPSIIRALQDLTGTNPLDLPMDDKKVMKIFSSTETLGIKHDFSNNEIGTLGIPEFGTGFVRGMLKDVYPSKFSEMIRISGLSHGTDVWLNNAQDLVKNGTATFDQIISTRDDIMNALIQQGLDKKKSFTIMETVRKGRTLSDETLAYMKDNGVADWYIESCKKIQYLFPKAHAVAYCLMSYRIAYYKVYYPEAFYATYYNTKINDFKYSTVIGGLASIQSALSSLKDNFDLSQRDKQIRTVLEVAEEMAARDIRLEKADIYKSHATKFLLSDRKGYILPPLSAVDDISEAMAIDIVKEREKGEFISLEDLSSRTCVNKNALASLKNLQIIEGIQEKNQISLFDGLI